MANGPTPHRHGCHLPWRLFSQRGGVVQMADYPCDFHLARYKGPSTRAFLNLYRDDSMIQMRATTCGDCLADLVTGWIPRALAMTEAGHWDPLDEEATLDALWRPQEARQSPRYGRNGR